MSTTSSGAGTATTVLVEVPWWRPGDLGEDTDEILTELDAGSELSEAAGKRGQ